MDERLIVQVDQIERRTVAIRRSGGSFALAFLLVGALGAAQLNDPLVPNGSVSGYAASPDGERALYRANQDQVDVFELFSVSLRGAHEVTQLNPPLLANHDVDGFPVPVFSPDSTRVVYAERRPGSPGPIVEIYSVPSAGGTAVKVNGPLVTNGSVEFFVVAPDSWRVVYVAYQPGPFRRLYSRRIDGVGPVSDLAPGLQIRGFPLITPDSTRVVFVGRGTDSELYSVPIDGSAPPLELSTGGNVTEFSTMLHVSADSSRVVYRADAETVAAFEVFSVPIDGSAVPVKLNPPLPAFADASPWGISRDSSRVLYTADAVVDQEQRVYSVPITGGVAVELSAPMKWGGLVGATPDSTHVVFYADGGEDGSVQLYSVPIDGGSAPIELNGPLATGGNVFPYALISPAGGRVVYTADQEIDEKIELYSVAVDGSSAPVKLNQPLLPGDDVQQVFRIDPQGRRVLYYVDPLVGPIELFWAPIDRSVPATPIAARRPQRVAGSGSFLITPEGDRLLYADDLVIPGVQELYLIQLAPPSMRVP